MKNNKCVECGHAFTWKDVFINIWQAYKPITCHTCNQHYKVTNGSQALVTMIVILPMLVFGELFSMFSLMPKLAIMLLIGSIISLFVPFLVKYKHVPVKVTK